MATSERYEPKCFDTKSIIDDAITSLMMIGASREAALELLLIGAAVRMEDSAEVRRTFEDIEDGLMC